ncbi:Hypothetical_protein [Hexamita inflata]|uniref:Hypothetical_protein n=1 Tax=Hexamita inflata TaxID=28002 RepID=A0ABP1J6J8_9EUKA
MLNSFSCGKVAMKQIFWTTLKASFKVFTFIFPEIESTSFKKFELKSAYSRFTRSFRSTVCRKLPRRSRCVMLTCRFIPWVEHRRLQTITSEVACVGILSTCTSVWCSTKLYNFLQFWLNEIFQLIYSRQDTNIEVQLLGHGTQVLMKFIDGKISKQFWWHFRGTDETSLQVE